MNDLLRKAAHALADVANDPVKAASEASTWIKAARADALGDDDWDTVYFLECIVHCIKQEYDAAHRIVTTVPHSGSATADWRQLTTFVYMYRSPLDGHERALQECDEAIRWMTLDAKGENADRLLANLHGRKGFHHLNLNQYHDAEASCRLAFDLCRDYVGPLRLMAIISLHRGEPKQAINYLSESIVRRTGEPNFWDHANRGKALLDIGDIHGSIRDLRAANYLNPGNPIVLSNLGIAIDLWGDTSQAWRLYGEALQVDFDCAPAHHNRGVLFCRLKNYAEAENCFTRAIRSEPTAPLLQFNRGVCRYEQHKYGEALNDLNKAEANGYRSWDLFYLKGMCTGQLKEYTTALRLLEYAARYPFVPAGVESNIWNNMGVIAHKMDELRTAHQCFAKAVMIDPLNNLASTNFDRMEINMSGQGMEPTDESSIDISLLQFSPFVANLSSSDLLSAASIVSNFASIGVAIALA